MNIRLTTLIGLCAAITAITGTGHAINETPILSSDANRDGAIDEHDAMRGPWRWSFGALIPVNIDDDDGDGLEDVRDHSVNGEADRLDFAPLLLTAPACETIALDATGAAPFVNLFLETENGWRRLDASDVIRLPWQPVHQIWIEAKQFADGEWDGMVKINAAAYDGYTLIDSGSIELRAAPWLMTPNTAPVETLYVRDRGEDNEAFIEELAGQCKLAGVELAIAPPSDLWQEMWMQDTMEIGYSQTPGEDRVLTNSSALKANRMADDDVDTFARSLLEPDFGWLKQGEARETAPGDQWIDWYGNLEVTPPIGEWRLGRIYYGDSGSGTMHPQIRAFLDAQELQGPAIRVDVSWLMIRHVDEIVSFLPGVDGEPMMLIVSPGDAVSFLESLAENGHGGAAINRGFHNETTVAELANDERLMSHNRMLQTSHIDAIARQFKKELKLRDDQIKRIPVLFTPDGDAVWPNMVNSVLVNGRFLISDPQGPVIDGEDALQRLMLDRLHGADVTPVFLEDRYYHEHKGNTHCATNAKRSPPASPFWLHLPLHAVEPDWARLDFAELIDAAPPEVEQDIRAGEYNLARARLLDLANTIDDVELQRFYLREEERIRRIQRDYSLTIDRAMELLDERVNDFQPHEFWTWLSLGRFDLRRLNGETRLLGSSVSNLYFRYPEIRERWLRRSSEFASARADTAAYALNRYPAPNEKQGARRLTIQMKVMPREGAPPLKPGETVRAWLPFPKELEYQTDVELISTNAKVYSIADNYAPHRSVYMEKTIEDGDDWSFEIKYAYTAHPRYDAIDPERVTRFLPAGVERFLEEEPPHVRFHQEFVELADRIVGDETNPYWIAYRIYDWLSGYANYSYAREYSTLTDISTYVYDNQYGDCGQLTLLFINLCRIKGVPARWESGWMIFPEGKNLHDWARIYLSPYGWVPVDPNFGLSARQTWSGINNDQREELFEFYFGRMSPYRLIANDLHGAEHTPEKRYPRSDDVDFQRGELETADGNLYFDRFTYRLDIISDEPAN